MQIIDLVTSYNKLAMWFPEIPQYAVSDHLALQFTVAKAGELASGNTLLSAVTERGVSGCSWWLAATRLRGFCNMRDGDAAYAVAH